jgi:hypothetical protein
MERGGAGRGGACCPAGTQGAQGAGAGLSGQAAGGLLAGGLLMLLGLAVSLAEQQVQWRRHSRVGFTVYEVKQLLQQPGSCVVLGLDHGLYQG